VREVVVIGRDSKMPEVFRLGLGAAHTRVPRGKGGWVVCESMGLRLRRRPGARPVLEVEDVHNRGPDS
jgi:hypothetical protein